VVFQFVKVNATAQLQGRLMDSGLSAPPGGSPVAFTLSNFVQRNFCFHCHPFLASVSIYAWRDEPEHNNPDFPAMQV
jgi:hypothetical protein